MHSILDYRIDKIISLVNLGVDMWEEAGRLLVNLRLEDPLIFQKIIEEHKDLSLEMLLALEAIGEKKLHPKTLLLPPHIASRIAEMPYADQEYLARQGKVDVKEREGTHSQMLSSQLSRRDAKQVCSPSGIIPPEKQKVAVKVKREHDLGLFELTYKFGRLECKKVSHNTHPNRPVVLFLIEGKKIIHLLRTEGIV